jgi:predicted helicase
MSALEELLDHYRKTAKNERDKGDKFERLTKFFLENDSRFSDRFSDVWIWNKFPGNEGKVDTGIDLVAKEKYSDGYCAIQCKFYGDKTTVDKSNIDSFFTASGKDIYTSRLIFATTDNWTKHAEDALKNQKIPINRMTTDDMESGSIDWEQFNTDSFTAPQRRKNGIREHQKKAIENVIKGFESSERGKLIMACGTGKTFTSLKIAEEIGGTILFLAPSISLVSQTFNEWINQSNIPVSSIIVCSDISIRAEESDDIHTYDLACPPTTNPETLAKVASVEFQPDKLNVIFCTYQSIQVVIDAQEKGLPEFDLVVCDEAHRTTGVTLSDREDSHFTRIHNGDLLKARRRLYMTATPKIYADSMVSKANQEDAEVFSMDNEALYGTEFHRLGFGEAVEKGLLSDYKVMVLGVEEEYASKFLQQDNELQIDDDEIKIIGCWNGLSKKLIEGQNEGNPMRRAVAFSRSIKDSKNFKDLFSKTVKRFVEQSGQEGDLLECEVDHVDGTMSSLERQGKLKWLKADTSEQGNICRILSNAKCLSEGVDVPTLDAVLFLNPRNSMVDVVQSVGRAMRKAEGKQYGYIIIPISIPADVDPEKALNDNKRYKVVWDVCQALRAHDDRFEATVNKIKFNVNKPDQIDVTIIGAGKGAGKEPQNETDPGKKPDIGGASVTQLKLDLPTAENWQNAILGKIAKKCGSRDYWENWAKDVSVIAESHIDRIKLLLRGSDQDHQKAFEQFVKGLRKNLNPSVTEEDAIEMLAQHLITKPVFDALFEGYEFAKNNPVSKSFKKMIDLLEDQNFERDQKKLDEFYDSVRRKVGGIDNAAAKQTVIRELYDKFFNLAFPKMAERLGIVYTPIEVVDFIINSAEVVLKDEFDLSLTDRSVHILDPFTGTGTFMVRLLQSGHIKSEDLEFKYLNNLHANEIVLLAYYIAAINIEETFHDLNEAHKYEPFDGIVLADTFQINEGKSEFEEKMFPENNKRVKKQMESPIQVIIGNPPYSVGQESQNDGNKNLSYEFLDNRIEATYSRNSSAVLKKSLYDSYVRAIRWASDRIKDQGVICFVTNGSFIDNNSMDGLRKSLQSEFNTLYIFNLRGNARTQGEQRRKEKGNIFGEGSRTPVAISILVKNPKKSGEGKIHYYDIGDYLSREEKLKIVQSFGSIEAINWSELTPNDSGDWINQRDPTFDSFMPLSSKSLNSEDLFQTYSLGASTSRDAWVYGFSKASVIENMSNMTNFYNDQIDIFNEKYKDSLPPTSIEKQKLADSFIDRRSSKISWSTGLIANLARNKRAVFDKSKVVVSLYRPFTKEFLYFDDLMIERPSQNKLIFPGNQKNLAIYINGTSSSKGFSTLMTDLISNHHMLDSGLCFPLYVFKDENQKDNLNIDLFEDSRRDNISDEKLLRFQNKYKKLDGVKITKEDIFYYVYGILHSIEYRERFKSNLNKMAPRVPLVKDFWGFSRSGRELASWHLNYETVEPYPLEQKGQVSFEDPTLFQVNKMVFAKTNGKEDRTSIIFNGSLTLGGIPLEAYDYVINGKSAIDWVMERYQVTIDKDSGIKNNPNDWCSELEDPEYILNLLKRVVAVSVATVKIVSSLPKFDELN